MADLLLDTGHHQTLLNPHTLHTGMFQGEDEGRLSWSQRCEVKGDPLRVYGPLKCTDLQTLDNLDSPRQALWQT